MLKIKNTKGEELMSIKDNGDEEFHSLKFKEEYEQAESQKDNMQSEGE